MPCKMWDEIIYRLPNFNGCTIGVWKWINNSIPHIHNYLSMMGLKLNHVSRRGPWAVVWWASVSSFFHLKYLRILAILYIFMFSCFANNSILYFTGEKLRFCTKKRETVRILLLQSFSGDFHLARVAKFILRLSVISDEYPSGSKFNQNI